MEKLFKAAVERGASDLHIKAGDFFRARIHGDLVPLTNQKLTPDQVKQIALHLMTNEDDKKLIDKIQDYHSLAGIDYQVRVPRPIRAHRFRRRVKGRAERGNRVICDAKSARP